MVFLLARFLVVLFVLLYIPFTKTHAAIASCNSVVSPSSMETSSQTTVGVVVENQDSSEAIYSVRINAPSLVSASLGQSSDWNVSQNGNSFVFSGNTIGFAGASTFLITINTLEVTGSEEWEIGAIDNDGDETICGGSVGFTVNEPGTSITISSVSVSSLTNSSVNLSFTTSDAATSILYYGKTNLYGSVKSITSAATNHTYTLEDLDKDTTYHFQITATSENYSTSTNDLSFTTSSNTGTTSVTVTTVTNTVTQADSTKPTIHLNSISSTIGRSVPTISGVAQDNGGVDAIEYSRDGISWTGISISKSSTVNFSFTPQGLRDGRNTIRVRAKDASGNSATDSVSFSLDRTGPTITLSTKFNSSYKQAPVIEGEVKDISGVETVEYTLDGSTWSTVGELSEGSTARDFRINQSTMDDGEYELTMRATDGVGNSTTSKPQSFSIDRLPPRIGAIILSLGNQVLSPSIAQDIVTIPGVTHELTTSVIGGPTTVTAVVVKNETHQKRTIEMSKNKGSSLWKIPIVFDESGKYMLEMTAKDKSGEVTKSSIGIQVVANGTIQSTSPTSSLVTLYTLDQTTGDYVVWDGSPYNQQNPVETQGQFAFLPPSGTYYLKIKPQKGHRDVISSAVTIPSQLPITPQLNLRSQFSFNIGRFSVTLPTFTPDRLTITPYTQVQPIQEISLPFPSIKLTTDDDTISKTLLEGKWTLITILNTYTPSTPTVLFQLSEMKKQYPDIRFIVVVPHESRSSVSLYKERGGYEVTMIADPDGDLLETIPYPVAPTFYLFNRLSTGVFRIDGHLSDINTLLDKAI